MATPMNETQWKAQLKKFNVPVEYYDGNWFKRGRPPTKGPFKDVHGIVIHHTGGPLTNSDAYSKFLFVTGRSDLPAPLCHAEGRADGTIVMGAGGRANHAGLGNSKSLTAVLTESTPYDRELKPTSNDNGQDGNRHFYGIEIDYGRSAEGPTEIQITSAIRWAAAICDFHGWTGASIIGHREWTYTKSDPARIKMYEFRRRVDELLKEVNGTSTPVPVPVPDTPKTYTVRPGDTLTSIAKKYSLTVQQLAKWNNITDPNKIRVGQVLKLTETATDPAPTPVGNYNYPADILGKNWKINWADKELKQPQLAHYSNKWFQLGPEKKSILWRCWHGDKTTSGSKNPRSEGREMTANGLKEISWNALQGTHTLEHEFQINRFTKKRPHTVVGQIHDDNDDVTVWRAEQIKGTNKYKLWITDGDNTHAHLAGTFKIGERVKIRYHVHGGVISFFVNDVKLDFTLKTKSKKCYFKAGAYLQSNDETAPGESNDEFTEVESFLIKATHS